MNGTLEQRRQAFRAVVTWSLGGHTIQCLDEARTLLIDHHAYIRLTPTEYKLIQALLRGEAVRDEVLAESVLHSKAGQMDAWIRANLDRHIDNIREKLRWSEVGIQIYRVNRYGYILLEDVPEEGVSEGESASSPTQPLRS
jgi:DNA-binding response OmpR family regulator